jgi:hypothetical protein
MKRPVILADPIKARCSRALADHRRRARTIARTWGGED